MGIFQSIKEAFSFIRKDRKYNASQEEFDSIIAYGYNLAIISTVEHLKQNLEENDWQDQNFFYYCRYEIFTLKRLTNLMRILIEDKYHLNHEYTPMLKAIEAELEDLDEYLYTTGEITEEKKKCLIKVLDRICDRYEQISLLCRMIALA